jgi:hypothetical protein
MAEYIHNLIFNGRMPVVKSKLIIIALLSSASLICVYPQESKLIEKWSDNTAYLIPAGKWESGISQSFRYGINERIELRSYALWIPVLPNAGVKIRIGSTNGFLFSSEHSISCPTVFLNVMSFKGTGGFISPQFSFPFMLAFSNRLLSTRQIGSYSLLTGDAGFVFALRESKPDYQSSIDLPVIYQRMAHFYEGSSVRAGISYKGRISENLFFENSIKVYVITRSRDNLFIENRGSILWSSKKSVRLKPGYTLSWGNYPFGNYWQLWPTFDFIFGSKSKKGV